MEAGLAARREVDRGFGALKAALEALRHHLREMGGPQAGLAGAAARAELRRVLAQAEMARAWLDLQAWHAGVALAYREEESARAELSLPATRSAQRRRLAAWLAAVRDLQCRVAEETAAALGLGRLLLLRAACPEVEHQPGQPAVHTAQRQAAPASE